MMTPEPREVVFSFSFGFAKLNPKNSFKNGSLNICSIPALLTVFVVEIFTTESFACATES